MAERIANQVEYDPDEAAALIRQIPSVQACRLVEQDGLLREIHVLSGDNRSPKQIARDIQSALMAQFDLYIDHRFISIAQIPGVFSDLDQPAPPKHSADRLVCARLSLSIEKCAVEAKVTLRLGERCVEATEQAPPTLQDRRRAVAGATVKAISAFLQEGSHIRLCDTGETMMSGSRVILASVALENGLVTEQLIGAAFGREDLDMTAVHAVLDAVNRRLRLGG